MDEMVDGETLSLGMLGGSVVSFLTRGNSEARHETQQRRAIHSRQS